MGIFLGGNVPKEARQAIEMLAAQHHLLVTYIGEMRNAPKDDILDEFDIFVRARHLNLHRSERVTLLMEAHRILGSSQEAMKMVPFRMFLREAWSKDYGLSWTAIEIMHFAASEEGFDFQDFSPRGDCRTLVTKNLPSRVGNILARAGVRWMEILPHLTAEEIGDLRNIGPVNVKQITETLARQGLEIGSKV